MAQPTTAGTSAREFLPGAEGQIVGPFQVNGNNPTAQKVAYYQRDGQGSVVRTVGTAGAQLNSVGGYDAWGHPASVSDSSDGYGLPLGYLGLPYDTAAGGLTWAHARWYDAASGRMLSRDPLGGGLAAPQSQNRYAYAQDNPTTLMDPSGLSPVVSGISGTSASGLTNSELQNLLGFVGLAGSLIVAFASAGAFLVAGGFALIPLLFLVGALLLLVATLALFTADFWGSGAGFGLALALAVLFVAAVEAFFLLLIVAAFASIAPLLLVVGLFALTFLAMTMIANQELQNNTAAKPA